MDETESNLLRVSGVPKTSLEENEIIATSRKYNILSFSKAQKEAGSYFLGPVVKTCCRPPVKQCLARKKGRDDYYLMKILTLDDNNCSFEKRTFFHNEFTILSLLKNCPGVIQLHDFFKDYVYEENLEGRKCRKVKRVCMVLECLIPHGYHNSEYIPLNEFLKKNKLSETEALHIFYNLLLVLADLHKRNITHGDLKLSNIILNRKTLKVKLIDFYYSKLLPSDSEMHHNLCNHHVSLVTLIEEHTFTKSYDMWSAGIILLSMLNVCSRFTGLLSPTNRSLLDFYWKVIENDKSKTLYFSEGTKKLLRRVLYKNPEFRLKASEAVEMVYKLIKLYRSKSHNYLLSNYSDQVVPECPDFDSKDELKKNLEATNSSEISLRSTDSENLGEDRDVFEGDNVYENTSHDSGQCFSNSSESSKLPEKNLLLRNKYIKSAMRRLGVTSFNNISALSFDYSKTSLSRK